MRRIGAHSGVTASNVVFDPANRRLDHTMIMLFRLLKHLEQALDVLFQLENENAKNTLAFGSSISKSASQVRPNPWNCFRRQ